MDSGARRSMMIAAGLISATVAVALIATSWMRGGLSGSSSPDLVPSASFPVEGRANSVMMVPDAILARARDDGAQIAVAGWYQQRRLISCPAPPFQPVPVIEGPCSIAGLLMADPESIVTVFENGMEMRPAIGPSIEVSFDGPDTNWERPLPRLGGSVPLPVVFIGHFDDIRAGGCQPENRTSCADRFVVTDVPWVNGVDRP
ncbi:MAG: hypothetical protein V4515_13175 [Chloroflexota bacterium]